MATKTIHTLAYKLSVDNAKFNAGMSASKKEVSEAKKVMESMRSPIDRHHAEMSSLHTMYGKGLITQKAYTRALRDQRQQMWESSKTAKALKGGLAALATATVAAGAGTLRVVTEQVDKIDQLNKAAKRINVPIEELSKIMYVANRAADLGAEDTQAALSTMTKTISAANAGNAKATKLLERLGLLAEDLQQLTPEKQLIEIAGAVGSLTSENEKLEITSKLLGNEKMVAVIGQGASNLEKQLSAVKAIAEVTQDEADKLSATKDSLEDFAAAWDKIKRNIAVSATPFASDVAAGMQSVNEKTLWRQVSNAISGTWKEWGGDDPSMPIRKAITDPAERARLRAERGIVTEKDAEPYYKAMIMELQRISEVIATQRNQPGLGN